MQKRFIVHQRVDGHEWPGLVAAEAEAESNTGGAVAVPAEVVAVATGSITAVRQGPESHL